MRWLVLHSVLNDLDVEHVVEVPPSASSSCGPPPAASPAGRRRSPSPWSAQHIVARYGWLFDVPSSRADGHDIADAVALATLGLARLGCHYAPWTTTGAAPSGHHVARGHGDRRRPAHPRDLDHPASAVTTMTTEGLTP